MTTDMRTATEPKSDQINADDFMGGPRTFKIISVAIRPGTEQPVQIELEGSKPWRPCKSMSRVLVAAWGADAKEYAGKSVTLYRDPTVKWGGLEVGGIRVSHLSDISTQMTMALTATKGSRKPYTVKPLMVERAPQIDVDALVAKLKAAPDMGALVSCWTDDVMTVWKSLSKPDQTRLTAAKDARKLDLSAPEPGSEG